MIRKFFKWIFKNELQQLQAQINRTKEATSSYEAQEKIIKNILQNIDVSVDVHEYCRHSNSWAVISLQGQKTDYIKFVDLGNSNIREIGLFLRGFERHANIKVDASPHTTGFLRISRNKTF
jgi:type I site-specific restriction-modification system R (restriction) subunit